MKTGRLLLCLVAGTISLGGCFKGSVPPNIPCAVSVAQNQVNIDFKKANGGSISVKLVLPQERKIQAFKEDVTRYEGALYSNGNQLVTFTVNADSGGSVVNFLNLSEGDYTLMIRAYDAANQQVNQSAPQADEVGTFTVQKNFKSRLVSVSVPLKDNYLGYPDGGLDVDIAAITGLMQKHPRTPVVAERSTPDQSRTLGEDAVVPSPIDNEDHLNIGGLVNKITNGVYTAFSTNKNGENVQYIGRAVFSSTMLDPINPGNVTLILSLCGKTKKFYFDASNNLQAITDLAEVPKYFAYVDPEQAPNETYYSSLYSGGTTARRYFYLDLTRNVNELFFGLNPDDSLIGAILSDPEFGVIHIQCLQPQDAFGLIGSDINISTYPNRKETPSVGYNPISNEYLIGWRDLARALGERCEVYDSIYAQRVCNRGNLIGGEILVDHYSVCSPASEYKPLVVSNSNSGDYVLCYQEGYHPATNVALISMDGIVRKVVGCFGSYSSNNGIAYNSNDNEFLVTSYNNVMDYYAMRRYTGDLTSLGDEVRDNSMGGGIDIVFNPILNEYLCSNRRIGGNLNIIGSPLVIKGSEASIACNTLAGNYLVTYIENNSIECYFANINQAGEWGYNPYGPSSGFSISYFGNPRHPKVKFNKLLNEYLVVWEDNRNGNSDIFAQRVSTTGRMIGDNIPIAIGVSVQDQPAIDASTTERRYFVTWREQVNSEQSNIVGRFIGIKN